MSGKLVRRIVMLGFTIVLSNVAAQARQLPVPESSSPTVRVPRQIGINGVIKDRAGRPLSGVVGLKLALYKEQYGGTPLWTEIQNAAFDEGRYYILLGAYTGDGLPLDLFTAGETRWLGVQALLSGEDEQARLLFVSVPYAMKSADADTLGGKPASAYQLAPEAGSEGKPASDTAPRTALATKGDGPVISAATIGDAGYLGMFVNTTDLQNSNIFQSGTNIGVGTTAPVSPLHATGTSTSAVSVLTLENSNITSNTTRALNLDFVGRDTGGNRKTVGQIRAQLDQVNANDSHLAFSTRQGNSLIEHLRITHQGLVGIGTTNPSAHLDVGNGAVKAFTLFGDTGHLRKLFARDSSTGDVAVLTLDNTNTTSNMTRAVSVEFVLRDTVGNAKTGGQIQTQIDEVNGNDAHMAFLTRQGNFLSEKVRIQNNGSVGIGVTMPAAKLDVSGTVKATAFSGDGSALTNLPPGPVTLGANTFTGTQTISGANLNASGTVSGSQLISTVSTGTAPLAVTSTTQVANLNASLLGGQPASSFVPASSSALTRGITYLGGCDACSALTDADDQRTIYANVVAPMTINSVTCFSNEGTPSINLQRDDNTPANILSADLVCSTSGTTTTSFSGSEATLNLNDKVDFVMENAGGTAKRVTVVIKATMN